MNRHESQWEDSMRTTTNLLAVATLALALAGCAGKNFVRPDAEGLKNGQTTYSQVIQKMGSPQREGTALKNEQTVKTASYAYASAGGQALHSGVTAARGIAFYFYNDLMVGNEFVSSYADDNTDFDDGKIPAIVKGKTTRAEVLQLMGKPSGYYIYPMIKAKSGDAAVYVFSEVKGGAFNMKFSRKTLVVTFDSSGIVTDVEFASSGTN
jgi:outer membrane protein assembly factor BamE (lipoprotein component of BamABCDE complex)